MAKTFPARTRKCEWAKIKKVRWEKGSHRAEKAHLRLLFAVWKRKIRGWEADIVARYGCSGV